VLHRNPFRSRPLTLYKFVEKRWHDAFFETGSLRIGTVHQFRDTVAHGVVRGDENEGRHLVTRRDIKGIVVTPNEPLVSEILPPGSLVANMDFSVQRVAADAFIFCTANKFREALFKQWFERERTDSCYVIFDVDGFRRAVATALGARITDKHFVEHCIYVGSETNYKAPHSTAWPGIVKANGFEWQAEARFVWEAKAVQPVEPANLLVPDAREYCRPWAGLVNGSVRYHKPKRGCRTQ
jgi:hypothetical protein